MSSQPVTTRPKLDLSRWRNVPLILMVVGGALALLGFFVRRDEFALAWLNAFMFFVSICGGALFLVIIHHLFDAGWSVPIRRFCEHIAALCVPWLFLLFIPVGLLAPRLYEWMHDSPETDAALRAKLPLFTPVGFWATSIFCFLVWWLLSNRLRYWSVKQDETGAALPTYRMRFYSAIGIFLFALTLTLASVLWMKAVQHDWYSTMYGVYYFAGSVWVMLATAYVITMVLDCRGVLSDVLHEHQYYFIGSLLFAFTVFYAYVHFAQYFIIWNGNIPDETSWYVIREQGTWWWVGLVIIFGHFFVPFLALLRIDVKNMFKFMVPVAAWTWLMHYVDLAFNVIPSRHENGYLFAWIWLHLGCWAFMTGLFASPFLLHYWKYPPYPLKEPRLLTPLRYYHAVP